MSDESNDAQNTAFEECHHYTRLVQVPWDIRKLIKPDLQLCPSLTRFSYYHQRFSIFSRYDDGILMTDGAWYGVTPEPVAKYGTIPREFMTTSFTKFEGRPPSMWQPRLRRKRQS